MSITPSPAGCETCNKSGLSLLLLRPSPVAKKGPLVPLGADAVTSDEALVKGLVPSRALTESRYALRLLRAGFIHVYIETPPPGVKNWLIYRVTESADLVAQGNPVFAQMPRPEACYRKEHNAAGMRLLHIPQAHRIDAVWIAYSANLWNDKLQKANAANPQVMQKVSLAGGSPNTFKPTVAALKEKVLECALMTLCINKGLEQDFRFNTLAVNVESLAGNLVKAAQCHPKTQGKELAVVLRDPVGLAAELNALRLRRQEVSDQYQMRPENRQPVEVNKAIELFKGNLIADIDARSMDAVSPVMTHGAYTDIMRVKPNPKGWPEETQWEPIEDKAELLQRGPGAGRVTFPDQPQRARTWATRQVEATWSRMDKYYDEGHRSAWKTDYAKHMEEHHLKELKRFEADWGAALEGHVLPYFATHFDAKDKNDPKEVARRGCCAGEVYSREAWLAYSPAPLTNACECVFEAQLDADIQDDRAVMLRAVMANQASLWEQLAADSGDGDGKRDKIYDFMKGLIGETKGTLTPQRLAWLTNVTLGFSVGITSALASAAMQGATAAIDKAKGAPIDPKALARLSIAQSMALIHRASEEALAASLAGRKPNAPVFFIAHFDPDTAQQIMQGRGRPVNKKTRREWARKGRVAIGIYSDADTVTKLNVKPEVVTRELAIQAQQVHLQEQAPAFKKSLSAGAVAGSVMVMPVEKFMGIYEAHRKEAMRAPSLVMGSLKQGALSLDGRLAVGSMIAQGLGIVHGLGNYNKAKEEGDAQKIRDAQLSLADGAAGFAGGFLELAGAVWEARLITTVGEAGARASPLLSFVRGLAFGAGAAGNAVNAVMAFRAAAVQEEKGNVELGRWMYRAGILFGGGGVPLSILALHSAAEAAVKRGLIWGAGEAMVSRVGTALATRALLLSVPGWGWLLTGIAVGHTVYVAMVTPTPFQQWLKGCYFGKPDGGGVAKRDSWTAEEDALKKMQEEVMSDAEKQQKQRKALNDRLQETTRA
ncbi:T6SS effector BTH_I2691 family protein [Variovorax sp. YR752]|uniref:T6SS effector BTH_I2691 family protein n=1 Tax=Variovorax sp. YR752 TaxID=1884383 RepID=UPI0031381529